MIEIPLDAAVTCTDGDVGVSSAIVLNRWTRRATRLVVEDRGFAPIERLVPMDRVAASSSDLIELDCAAADLDGMERFRETFYLQSAGPGPDDSDSTADAILVEPFGNVEGHYLPVVEERVPQGEVAIERGMAVEATDGGVGKAAGLLVDSLGGRVSHLMVTERHLFRLAKVAVPLESIQRVGASAIHLRLDKEAVAGLPEPPPAQPA